MNIIYHQFFDRKNKIHYRSLQQTKEREIVLRFQKFAPILINFRLRYIIHTTYISFQISNGPHNFFRKFPFYNVREKQHLLILK